MKKQNHIRRDSAPYTTGLGRARLNPGSIEALQVGCTCPIVDNGHGVGYHGVEGMFIVAEGCPVHHRLVTDVSHLPSRNGSTEM